MFERFTVYNTSLSLFTALKPKANILATVDFRFEDLSGHFLLGSLLHQAFIIACQNTLWRSSEKSLLNLCVVLRLQRLIAAY